MADTYNCNKVIKSCIYSYNVSGKYLLCDYICKTGHMRDCKPEECDKYVKRSGKRNKGEQPHGSSPTGCNTAAVL